MTTTNDALRKALDCIKQSTEYKIGNPTFEQCEAALVEAIAQQAAPTNDKLREAIEQYEAALKEAFPRGATGSVFEHWNAARIAQQAAPEAAPQQQAQGESTKLGLWDSQWVNIVNAPELRDMDKEDAVHHAVKATEQKCVVNASEAIALKDAEIARLRATLDGCEKDAARYRFVRDASRSDVIAFELKHYAMETLDEYVDAAMEGERNLSAHKKDNP